MQKEYLICPIIVNEKMEIIDGQHRVKAAEFLGFPVYYNIIESYGLKQVQYLNANSKNWTIEDYINSYCDTGSESYKIYKEFKEYYKLPNKVCLTLLSGGDAGSSIKKLYDGNLVIHDVKRAARIAENILSLKGVVDVWDKVSFMLAIHTLDKKGVFKFSEFVGKLSKCHNKLRACTNVSDYIIQIEEIYNYKRREKVNLRY